MGTGLEGVRSQAYGWIDDACIIAQYQTFCDNIQVLKQALTKADQWAKRHASKFDPDKFGLILFTNPRAMEVVEDDGQTRETEDI
jgi:hypothetical protein